MIQINKNNLFLVLLLLIASLGYGQKTLGPITITNSDYEIEGKEKIVRIAGEHNGKTYNLATKGSDYYVTIFDSKSLKHIVTNKVELPDMNNKDLDFEDFMVLGDKVYVLGSVYNRKEKVNNLVAVEISEDGKLTANKTVLFDTKVTKKKERGAFYTKISPNEDQLLVLHASLFDKQSLIQYEIKLFDKDLGLIMSTLEKVPFEDRKDIEFTISDFDVNTNSDVFLVINESYRDRKKKQNIEKFEMHAFKVANQYAKEVIKVDFTGKEVVNCKMMAVDKGLIHLVGFYSSVRKNGKANKELKGVYSCVVDANSNAVENLKFNEFDHETKVKLLGERRANKGKDVKPYFFPHTIIEKEDGGLLFITEEAMITVLKSSGIGPLKFTPILFESNQMIITSLNPDGSVAWANVLPKTQKATATTLSLSFTAFAGNSNFSVGAGISIPLAMLGKGPEFLSAVPIYTNGELWMLFNDNPKNVGVTDIEDIRPMSKYRKSVPTIFIYDKDGNETRKDLQEAAEKEVVLRPRVYYRSSAKEYFMFSSRGSNNRMSRLNF